MADVQARVVTGSDGTVGLYLFSDEKTSGGASKRYAHLTLDEGEAILTLGTRDPDDHGMREVVMATLGESLVTAFAHVQWR